MTDKEKPSTRIYRDAKAESYKIAGTWPYEAIRSITKELDRIDELLDKLEGKE